MATSLVRIGAADNVVNIWSVEVMFVCCMCVTVCVCVSACARACVLSQHLGLYILILPCFQPITGACISMTLPL